MSKSKVIRYGTVLMPTVAKGIIGCFPGGVVQQYSNEGCKQFANISIEGEGRPVAPLEPLPTNLRYPSISLVLGCTQSYRQLWFWQLRMIKQLGGLAQLRKYMRERVTLGLRFHAKMKLLLSLHAKKQLATKTEDEICETLDEPMANYVKSVLPLLLSFADTDQILMEQYVTHPRLFYYGRFDAIVRYKDSFHLIDFKTTTTGSLKDGNDLNQLYSGPVQVAAYIGAVNSAPEYKFSSAIRKGAIVVVKEDGSAAEFAEINFDELQVYWQQWLTRVQQFWYEIENRPATRGTISFVYDGKS